MLATFSDADGVRRGTQVLEGPGPAGPFVPLTAGPVTPEGQRCLDGTLFVDDDQTPWLVCCHEWTDLGDGAVCTMRLDDDLAAAGEPVDLFRASSAPWATPVPDVEVDGGPAYVTDGPWLHRHPSGRLLMLWSSFADGAYAMGVATSASGSVLGPWTQSGETLIADDAGHGMVFEGPNGLLVTSHRPNTTPLERAVFRRLVTTTDSLAVAGD